MKWNNLWVWYRYAYLGCMVEANITNTIWMIIIIHLSCNSSTSTLLLLCLLGWSLNEKLSSLLWWLQWELLSLSDSLLSRSLLSENVGARGTTARFYRDKLRRLTDIYLYQCSATLYLVPSTKYRCYAILILNHILNVKYLIGASTASPTLMVKTENCLYMFCAIWEFAQSRDCVAHSRNPEIAQL